MKAVVVIARPDGQDIEVQSGPLQRLDRFRPIRRRDPQIGRLMDGLVCSDCSHGPAGHLVDVLGRFPGPLVPLIMALRVGPLVWPMQAGASSLWDGHHVWCRRDHPHVQSLALPVSLAGTNHRPVGLVLRYGRSLPANLADA